MRIFPFLALACVGCVQSDAGLDVASFEGDAATALSGMSAGAPQACVHRRELTSTKVIGGGEAFLFEGRSGTSYLNRPHGSCTGGPSDTLRFTSPDVRICQGDDVQMVGPGGLRGGSCTLTEFVPYRAAS